MLVVVFVLLLCQINAEVCKYKTVKSEQCSKFVKTRPCPTGRQIFKSLDRAEMYLSDGPTSNPFALN